MTDIVNNQEKADKINDTAASGAHAGRELFDEILNVFDLNGMEVSTYSPLALAYIGDSIYALVAKTVVLEQSFKKSRELHNSTVRYVSAVAQAKIVRYVTENNLLTKEEADILRKGRNAKSQSVAKNASANDYRLATGLEALIGYLYLSGDVTRMLEILKAGFNMLDNTNGTDGNDGDVNAI